MADMEDALYARLSGYAGLTALVSTRIYPQVAPQSADKPYVVYQRISGPRESAMGADLGLAHPRFQLDCYATSYLSAKAVGLQVRGALQRWRGTSAGVTIQDSFIEGDRDGYEEHTKLFRRSLDFIIWHVE